MRRNIVAALGTLSSVVLLLAYQTSHNGTVSASDQPVPSSAAANPTASSSPASSSSGSSSSSGGSGTKTYTGDAVQTRWGIVQVQISVSNGKIVSATAVRYPDENGHDQQINAYALPILNAEVVKAQSASIDSVSGATVTSDGYVASLQSALDAAHQ